MPKRHQHHVNVDAAYVPHFIHNHLATAQAIQRKYGVPAGVVLAQSALESNWGRTVKGNAYFGIKGRSPSGQSTTFDTHETVQGVSVATKGTFRAYSSYDDAADDYAHMLKHSARYRSAFLHIDSVGFATEIARNQYATDPQYGAKLISIIRSRHLDQYDVR
ncbi:glycoside hydrolase family 73 protein [Paraburkholderia sp. MM5384-R2]|uniref:glycoside hydrolase family 73 protein n=1 Tax=Paraburkholderia sp. MM5384-R2 TaxID=2723097 RepID=UPI001610DA57|nr:glucosaminidase domain-containing protein [Paraburkholderia sp. MM5384-R2]MBB5503074.1 flagellum-specific peptidoglycan hydrolase FlgJ [Paraburkholderia sp. MM5384-R2]